MKTQYRLFQSPPIFSILFVLFSALVLTACNGGAVPSLEEIETILIEDTADSIEAEAVEPELDPTPPSEADVDEDTAAQETVELENTEDLDEKDLADEDLDVSDDESSEEDDVSDEELTAVKAEWRAAETPALEVITLFADEEKHNYITNDIWAVWWPKDADLEDTAIMIGEMLADVRYQVRTEYGMIDPPNVADGSYVNVYIHDDESDADGFTEEDWGNSVGRNDLDLSYMTLSWEAKEDPVTILHEGFHVFQDGPNEGYQDDEDGVWFFEATANWYASIILGGSNNDTFYEALAIETVPHESMWFGGENVSEYDPEEVSWQRSLRMYAMSALLVYLTEEQGVSQDLIARGFYLPEYILPQEFLYREIPNLRTYFGNWAGENVAEFAYISRDQYAEAVEQFDNVGDDFDANPFAADLSNAGTEGEWFRPAPEQTPEDWSYNVIRVAGGVDSAYSFVFNGDETGSNGAPAFFETRVVVGDGEDGYRFHEFPLDEGLQGSLTVEVTAADDNIYLVVAAVPENFSGSQIYSYEVLIEQGAEAATVDNAPQADTLSTDEQTLLAIPELTLQTAYGDESIHGVITDGIFAVWYPLAWDIETEAREVATLLTEVRRDVRLNFGMADPPNLAQGHYVNVYIHDTEDDADGFPGEEEDWGNAVGGNDFGGLDMELAEYTDPLVIIHEGFHVFQETENPGYWYEGDGAWFSEATANWYASRWLGAAADEAFIEAGAIFAAPHESLWRSWDNSSEYDPESWQRTIHQYAMSSFLIFLTELQGIDVQLIAAGYNQTDYALPQELLYSRIPNFRELFGDWAGQNVADFAYINRTQFEIAQEELDWSGDPNDINPYVISLPNSGTDGDWFRPAAEVTPEDWSYNVIQIEGSIDGAYAFVFDGDAEGSAGAPAFFEARVVVGDGDDGYKYHQFPLDDGLEGSLTVEVTAADDYLYLIVAAVPENFEGSQLYSYEVLIESQ